MNRFSVSEHEDGYWYMRPDEDGEWVSYKDHEQAMAEKDREIAKWNELVGSFTQSQHKYMRKMEKLKIAHQQLMEKAVLFAELVANDHEGNWQDVAKAFLKERDHTHGTNT